MQMRFRSGGRAYSLVRPTTRVLRPVCGICGATAATKDALVTAAATLRHRGPDDDGIFGPDESGVGLAARRLSIIDVPGGHQPIQNEDGTVTVVFNGEIYNYKRLREHLLGRGHTLS